MLLRIGSIRYIEMHLGVENFRGHGKVLDLGETSTTYFCGVNCEVRRAIGE